MIVELPVLPGVLFLQLCAKFNKGVDQRRLHGNKGCLAVHRGLKHLEHYFDFPFSECAMEVASVQKKEVFPAGFGQSAWKGGLE